MQRFAAIASLVLLPIFAILLSSCNRQVDPNDPVRLRFWHAWGGYEGRMIQQLVDEFNASHPDIVVEASQFTIGDKLLASIAGGKPPDIATVWSYMLTPMGESGAFLPLNDYMTSSGYTREDYLPNVWDYGLYNDKRWGVPTTLNVTAIYYITHMVERAGLDPSTPPQTTAELQAWAEQLLTRDSRGNISSLGFVPTQTDVWFRAFGGELFDEKTRTFTLNHPGNIAGLSWMKNLIDTAGGMTTYRRFTAQYGKLDSPSNPLFMDKLAMKEDGQWVIRFFQEFAPDIDYGILPYPPGKAGGEQVAKLEGSFWAIPVGTRHPDKAWTFLSWLIAPEQNARLCAQFLNIPPLRASLDQPAFKQARQNEKFEQFVQLLVEGKALPQPDTPVNEQLYDKLDTGAQRVFSGNISADKFLQDIDKDLDAELKRTNSLMGTTD